ncbi:MAG: DUF2442 domain-containing protein [Planctomycetota bacterium]|nr:MAG: DUF2442 domain-containing protein [Planctomycetota bacterium]
MGKDVIGVEPIGDYRLALVSEDGERREVDVSTIVTLDGVFEPLRDPSYFRRVRVDPDAGTIVWPNGADICPDVLHERSQPIAKH